MIGKRNLIYLKRPHKDVEVNIFVHVASEKYPIKRHNFAGKIRKNLKERPFVSNVKESSGLEHKIFPIKSDHFALFKRTFPRVFLRQRQKE